MIKKQAIIDILKTVKYPGFSRDIVSFGFRNPLELLPLLIPIDNLPEIGSKFNSLSSENF